MLRNLLDDLESYWLLTFSGMWEEWKFRLLGRL